MKTRIIILAEHLAAVAAAGLWLFHYDALRGSDDARDEQSVVAFAAIACLTALLTCRAAEHEPARSVDASSGFLVGTFVTGAGLALAWPHCSTMTVPKALVAIVAGAWLLRWGFSR